MVIHIFSKSSRTVKTDLWYHYTYSRKKMIYITYLWSTNKNFPSKAWRDINWICLIFVRLCELAANVEICGSILPIATKQDKLHDSPSPSSCSSNPILAGAHDFRYPVHWITLYLLSETQNIDIWHFKIILSFYLNSVFSFGDSQLLYQLLLWFVTTFCISFGKRKIFLLQDIDVMHLVEHLSLQVT